MQLVKILIRSGISVEMALFYVDDVRLVLGGFMKGMAWSVKERLFVFS